MSLRACSRTELVSAIRPSRILPRRWRLRSRCPHRLPTTAESTTAFTLYVRKKNLTMFWLCVKNLNQFLSRALLFIWVMVPSLSSWSSSTTTRRMTRPPPTKWENTISPFHWSRGKSGGLFDSSCRCCHHRPCSRLPRKDWHARPSHTGGFTADASDLFSALQTGHFVSCFVLCEGKICTQLKCEHLQVSQVSNVGCCTVPCFLHCFGNGYQSHTWDLGWLRETVQWVPLYLNMDNQSSWKFKVHISMSHVLNRRYCFSN